VIRKLINYREELEIIKIGLYSLLKKPLLKEWEDLVKDINN